MILDRICGRKRNRSNVEIINKEIEGIKEDIRNGSGEAIEKLTWVQDQLRRSKKTLVLEVSN